jgi:uncharacterized protein YggU (UPF0235/DUF167 family)
VEPSTPACLSAAGGKGGVRLACTVQPNKPHSAVSNAAELLAEAAGGAPCPRLCVDLAAAPREGAANAALLQAVAKLLGVPKARASLIAGGKSRDKVVLLEGVALRELAERLRQAAGS